MLNLGDVNEFPSVLSAFIVRLGVKFSVRALRVMLFAILSFLKLGKKISRIPGDERLLVLVLFILIFTFLVNRVDRKTEVSELNVRKNLF
jgi:O-antigen ligase